MVKNETEALLRDVGNGCNKIIESVLNYLEILVTPSSPESILNAALNISDKVIIVRDGIDPEQFKVLRSKILKCGNDVKRQLSIDINSSYIAVKKDGNNKMEILIEQGVKNNGR
jgi:hypothetical protein